MQSRTLTRQIPYEHYHHHARLKYNKSIYLRAQMKTSNKKQCINSRTHSNTYTKTSRRITVESISIICITYIFCSSCM